MEYCLSVHHEKEEHGGNGHFDIYFTDDKTTCQFTYNWDDRIDCAVNIDVTLHGYGEESINLTQTCQWLVERIADSFQLSGVDLPRDCEICEAIKIIKDLNG